jgi:hypothetical protein
MVFIMTDEAQKPLEISWELALLILLYLLTAAAGFQRLFSAIQTWSFLTSVLPFSPAYLVASGSLWVILGLIAACWLCFNLKQTVTVLIISQLLITTTYWIERLFFFQNDPARANLPFALLMTMILMGFTAVVIFSPNQKKRFFTRR